MFYSQCGEDRWMAENWNSLGLPEVGTFVEVGASQGRENSNTLWLEETKGWRGVLVEPDLRQIIPLRQNRPKAEIMPVAITREDGVCSFGMMPTLDHSGLLRVDAEQIAVQGRTLSSVLRQFEVKRLDFLSIDTEGTEIDVWQSLDQSQWRPQIVIAEWDTIGLPPESHAAIECL